MPNSGVLISNDSLFTEHKTICEMKVGYWFLFHVYFNFTASEEMITTRHPKDLWICVWSTSSAECSYDVDKSSVVLNSPFSTSWNVIWIFENNIVFRVQLYNGVKISVNWSNHIESYDWQIEFYCLFIINNTNNCA